MDNFSQTGNELDDYYTCSECGSSNEACRCMAQEREEGDAFDWMGTTID